MADYLVSVSRQYIDDIPVLTNQIVNAAVLGGVGYLSYVNWDKTWDRRLVSSIFLGVFALWGGEG